MRGFTLQINGKSISAEAIEGGCVGIILTNKEGPFRICFSGIDNEMISYTWYASELTLGDRFCISYRNNVQPSVAMTVHDYKQLSEEEVLKRELELYWQLKKELENEHIL